MQNYSPLMGSQKTLRIVILYVLREKNVFLCSKTLVFNLQHVYFSSLYGPKNLSPLKCIK